MRQARRLNPTRGGMLRALRALPVARRLAAAGGVGVGVGLTLVTVGPRESALCWGGFSSRDRALVLPDGAKHVSDGGSSSDGDSSSNSEADAVLSEPQIEQVVSMLNGIVELRSFSEAEQQVIFRHSNAFLPPPPPPPPGCGMASKSSACFEEPQPITD